MEDSQVLMPEGYTWPLSFASCTDCDALEEVTEEQLTKVKQLAVEFLWRWTQRKFGVYTQTINPAEGTLKCRPFRPSTFEGRGPRHNLIAPPGSYSYFDPVRGTTRNPVNPQALLELPYLVGVDEVRIEGEEFTDYRVDGDLLIRTDDAFWPRDSLTSFSVTYRYGSEVPAGGQIAAGLLACEFAKAMCDDGDCQLPQRVKTVTREGVTVAVMDQFEDLDKGHTGIWLIDSWVASVLHSPRGGYVASPDFRMGDMFSPRYPSRIR